MENWKKDYNRYMGRGGISEEELNPPSIIHYCPSCGAYLWADKNHMSYRHCIYCGVNLKGKKLPYEKI